MLGLGGICYQDIKERRVYWFFFPWVGSTLCLIYFMRVADSTVFLLNLGVNLLLVTVLLLLSFLYTRLITKKPFLNYSLGLGDIFFFVAMALGFPIVTFLVLLVNGLLFSLLGFLLMKKQLKLPTVPLAGFMSIFLAIVLVYSTFFTTPSLYIY